MALDIDERHLLRLGHGEEELQTDKDFSRCLHATRGLCEQSEGQSAHLACHWGDCVNRVKGSLLTLHATGGTV